MSLEAFIWEEVTVMDDLYKYAELFAKCSAADQRK